MLRRPGLSSQSHGVVNGSTHRGDTPAPTLAAQIVDRISTTSRQSRSGTGENFEQLLLEINRSTASGNATVEHNVNVNCRLIYVVAKAGLEVLLTDDPFANRDLQLLHASTGLTIIYLTIQRTPEALFLDVPDGSAAAIPLFLWLIPKILCFTGVQKLEILQDKLGQVLSIASSAIPSTPYMWPRGGPMPHFLEECVGGTYPKDQPTSRTDISRATCLSRFSRTYASE